MIVDSIGNGPYVRRMIATPRETDLPVPVSESFHEQTDEELTENDIKRMDADDQVIQTILLGLPEDVYATVDSCRLFNEWEKFMSTDGESIESYYHQFMKLMNDLKRNKHFPENIASNLKFLNNLQPEWKRHVTIVLRTKNLHEVDFTQNYDFLKMKQDEVNKLRAERLVKSHDPLGLMAHSQKSYNVPKTYNDQSSSSTHLEQSFPINNKYNLQPSLNQNFMQPPMNSLEDINDPTEAMNAALIFFAKAFQLTTPTNNNQRTSSNPHNSQIAQPVINMSQDRQIQNVGGNGGNQFGQYTGQVAQNQQWYNAWQNGIANQNGTGNVVAVRAEGIGNRNQARCYNYRGLGHIARNCTARPRRRDAAYLQTQLLIAQKEEAGIQLQVEEFDFMAVVENKKLRHDFKTREDKFLDKEVDLEAKIKDLENILLKRDQTVQTMHMLNPKPDSFYHSNQKITLGYPNPSYLKKAQLKQQSLYNGNMLLEEHDPPAVYDSEETLKLAQERVFVPQTTKSKEKLFLSNVSNMVTVSKTISIPNEDLSDDTTPSVAQKFLNGVKSSLMTLQHVVKQKMTLEIHNWSSSAHKEVHKIISYEIAPIINQVDARVQNFEIQFLQEAAKFVRDFKSLAKEADESLDKQKSLELKIKRLLKASVSHDIMSIVKNGFVDVPSDLQTELDQVSKIVELEFQVVNYEREISHLKTSYKNLFDSITSNWVHAKLHNLIYENAQLRARVFENTFESMNNTSRTSVTPHVDKPKLSAVTPHSKKLYASIPSHFVPQPR
uniref:CCHC-type domain-containing protein n=1 Tax=Tanacetum cinerariifolium TaxID=118510 RepID=A0A6L2MNL2_TANCI|nr:hypothetical protein [Tanacetum cinerariifolium]